MSLPIVKQVRAKYPTPLGSKHGAFLVELARTLGNGAGLLAKDGGTFIEIPDGRKVAQDIIVYKVGNGAEHYDALVDGEGEAKPTWHLIGPVDPARYVDVSGTGPTPPSPHPPAPPLPIPPPPVPTPPVPTGPTHPYPVHIALGAEIGDILGNTAGSPYVGNAKAIGEATAHLLWKVQYEGYSLDAARENARKRSRGEAAD